MEFYCGFYLRAAIIQERLLKVSLRYWKSLKHLIQNEIEMLRIHEKNPYIHGAINFREIVKLPIHKQCENYVRFCRKNFVKSNSY